MKAVSVLDIQSTGLKPQTQHFNTVSGYPECFVRSFLIGCL